MIARGSPHSARTPGPDHGPSRPVWRAQWLWLGLLAPFVVTAVVVAIVLLVLPR